MKKSLAINILNNLNEYSENNKENYRVRALNRLEYEDKFHQWVDGKDILGIAQISNNDTSYYFVFVDWLMNYENYYIVVMSQNKSNTLIEMHKINEEYNSMNIEWRYQPSKRDGRNIERKECFIKYYGNIVSRIEVPKKVEDIEDFLDSVFDLIYKRIKSDQIEFNQNIQNSFPEGTLYERVHKKRERNSKLIQLVKEERFKQNNKLECEICGFDFYKVYKELGYGFIEAHHTIPISELNEDSETRKEDIALVCSNCHSMLHRKRPWATIEEIKEVLEL